MKTLLAIALAAALLQDPTPPPAPPAPPPPAPEVKKDPLACTLSKIEKRDYCVTCKKWLAPTDMDNKGACKVCKTSFQKVDTCVKEPWQCKMHGNKLHAERCCGTKDCCLKKPNLARVIYKCDTCAEVAFVEADLKHKDPSEKDKCPGKPLKTCDKSTTFPHGGKEEK